MPRRRERKVKTSARPKERKGLRIPPALQRRLLECAKIDRKKDPERAEVTFILLYRSLRNYDRMRPLLEDAPLQHEKVKQLRTAKVELAKLSKIVAEIQRLTINWGTGGRDYRAQRLPTDPSVWSMVAARFRFPTGPGGIGDMPCFRVPGPDGLEYPFDLNALAARVGHAVQMHDPFLRSMLLGLEQAVAETSGLLSASVASTKKLLGQGEKRGISARNHLVHNLAKSFNFVHAVARQRNAPTKRPAADKGSRLERRKDFVKSALAGLAGIYLAPRSIENILGADLIDQAHVLVPDGKLVEARSKKPDDPPWPNDRDWPALLGVLRRSPRVVELAPFHVADLAWLMMFDHQDPISFDETADDAPT
jgi:hypothetical protein